LGIAGARSAGGAEYRHRLHGRYGMGRCRLLRLGVATPNIDALAARGIRFSHYTTHPICSPARAALLTGRNAHSVATGWLANNNPGFPGYFGDIPLDAPTIAETLRAAGYATIAVGKWHNSTDGAMPNPTWPTYRGFDRFYGFLEGEDRVFLSGAHRPQQHRRPDRRISRGLLRDR